MKITKQQLRQIIKEELLKEEFTQQLLAKAEGAIQSLIDDEDITGLSFQDGRVKELRRCLGELFDMAYAEESRLGHRP